MLHKIYFNIYIFYIYNTVYIYRDKVFCMCKYHIQISLSPSDITFFSESHGASRGFRGTKGGTSGAAGFRGFARGAKLLTT